MTYHNPHITGYYNPLYNLNSHGFFHCSPGNFLVKNTKLPSIGSTKIDLHLSWSIPPAGILVILVTPFFFDPKKNRSPLIEICGVPENKPFFPKQNQNAIGMFL